MSSSKRPTRREFLIAGSAATIAAASPALPAELATPAEEKAELPRSAAPWSPEELFQSGPQRTFTGERTTQIAMPIGGIGAGSICFNGYGGLQDFSIHTHPETTALPAGFTSNSAEAAFAILHIKGQTGITKLVEGPFPPFKIFDQGLQGQGLRRGGFEGFPRFARCTFKGEYPFGEATLTDPAIPIAVTVTAWNPFIPLDDKNSGIPCAILEYSLHNTAAHAVDYEFSYHLSHLAPGCQPDQASTANLAIPGKGAFLTNREAPTAESFGSAALLAFGETPRIKAMWLRSPGWEFDSLSALWREVSTGSFTENDGSNAVDHAGRNGASMLLAGNLAPGASRTHTVLITWHFPNCYLREGGVSEDPNVKGTQGCRTMAEGKPAPWRPYYASQWNDAREVALYIEQNCMSLRQRTVQFKEALFSST
ncbi:MAG TPA: GH116 family glycosyl-hydrolase, partial [Terracidiphilus sp.]